MHIKWFLLISLLFLLSCARESRNSIGFELSLEKGYPRWLKDSSYSSDQTSGIAFIGRDKNNIKTFLIAGDVGVIHRLKIKNDTLLSLFPITFGKEAEEFLDTFPKADLEEIDFDKFSGNVYVSIEGNLPDPEKFTCICKVNFKNDDPFSDEILSFQKLHIKPENLFLKFVGNNIGYEGFALDSDYFYLGLEGIKKDDYYTDSTLILIVGRKDLEIKKILSTKDVGIKTICGLYSYNNKDIIGIDRNNRKLFRILFNKDLTIGKIFITDITIQIPSYPAFTYVASLESVSMDDEQGIYLADDPWKQFFIPSGEILKKLDGETANNFKAFIPIIYKFKFAELQKVRE